MNRQKSRKPLLISIIICLALLLPFYLISIRNAQSSQIQDSWRELRMGLELEPHELRSDNLLVASLDAEGRPQTHNNRLHQYARSKRTALIDQVYRTGSELGTLRGGTIYFFKIQEGDGFRIALFDAGPQQKHMRRQIVSALISGIAVLLPIFFIYLAFAGRGKRFGTKSKSPLDIVFNDADRRLIGPHRLVVKGADRLTRARNENEEELLRQLASARSQSQQLIPLLERLLAGLQEEASGQIGAAASDFSFLVSKTVQAYELYFYRLGKELEYGILPGLKAQGTLALLLAIPCNLLDLAAATSAPGSLIKVTLSKDRAGSPLLLAFWDGSPINSKSSKTRRGGRELPTGSLPQLKKAVKAVRGRLTLQYEEGENRIQILLPRALSPLQPLVAYMSGINEPDLFANRENPFSS